MKKGIIWVVLCLSLLIPFSGSAQASPPAIRGESVGTAGPPGIDKIEPSLLQAMLSPQASPMSTGIVTLTSQADLSGITDPDRAARISQVINSLKLHAAATQQDLKALLEARQAEGKVGHFEQYWVFNGLVVTATVEVILEVAARPEVLTIASNDVLPAPAPQSSSGLPEPNLSLVNAPALWDLGFRGQGIVVASMDTGVDLSHPDLIDQWRGGTNSWFDPNGQHPTTPADIDGHGTWTMGVMVGRDTGGTAIGVAPDAQWIAVKIFNDQGTATLDAVHRGFQWLLDPDGDPDTPDTPYVLNNSWTFASPGCDLEFQLDMQALRAVGVLPVFAAGNSGPGSGTSVSPSNNPEAFAVGATNNSDLIYTYSSRGPSACDPEAIFPEIVAPGVSIHTTDLFGLYFSATGTSLAAPHAAAGVALLLNAFPDLTVDEQESALVEGAVDLGLAGPDSDFGSGRLDLLAAYNWLIERSGPAPPTATASQTATDTETPTDTPEPSPTPTPTPTDTDTPPHTPEPSPTPTPTLTQTGTPTNTARPTLTLGPSRTRPPSYTPKPTSTLGPSRTRQPSYTPRPTSTPGPSRTRPPSHTPGPSRTPPPETEDANSAGTISSGL